MKRFASSLLRRAIACAIAYAQIALFVPHGDVREQYAFAQSSTAPCALGSGKDGAAGNLAGTANTYYAPPAGTLAAGSTSVPLGSIDATSGGASTAVAANDELLILQMQDGNGTFNTSNTSAYGSGGSGGSGYTSAGNAGLYEYVTVVSVAGGVATIQGAGAGNGLINSYYENTALNQRYQIVRVPQYTTGTLTNTFRAAYWNGKVGGVAALDMASTLNLGGASVYATGDGFRGGALSVTSTSPASVLNSDYAASAAMNAAGTQPAFGTKGEGFAGSPHSVFYYTNFTTPSAPSAPTVNPTPGGSNGYAGGDQGMGAPANAGGGGTDQNPAANDQNSGGGGGANGGGGGNGGFPWTPNYSGSTPLYSNTGVHTATGYSAFNVEDIGGRGGAAVTSSVGRAFMGGGGGAGSNNNGSNNNPSNAYGSSGGVGGGIILLRLTDTSGTPATFYANGTTGLAPDNDGGGGGGAGGTVIITSPNAFSGITVNVNGAAGTTAAATASDTAITIQHGPGGGGGGGVVLTTSAVTATANGGANGTTTTGATTYGATSGQNGIIQTVSIDQVPGVQSGASCYSSGTSGTSSIYTGPIDAGDATYTGAAYTGSYDGTVSATNNNDLTARAIPLTNPSPVPANTAATVLAPIGNTFTVTAAPALNVPNELYYSDTKKNQYRAITLTGTAPISPSGWTMRICPDNAGAPNCAYTTPNTTCNTAAAQNKWMTVGAAGATTTSTFCYHIGASTPSPQAVKYWAVYTGPTGTYTAFARYDAVIQAADNQGTPATNKTHNELYAGFIPVAKTATVTSSGCPNMNATPPPSGVCPGGTVQYNVSYANVVAGGGMGTQGQLASAFIETSPGTLKIADDGLSGPAGTNWASKTSGLLSAVSDTIAGTTCTYNGGGAFVLGATNFSCTIGGGSFQLYPSGFTGQQSTGTLTFSVRAK